MTIVVGITGGIGSGKSTFSKEIVRRNFKLFDSDEEVSKIYKNPNKEFLQYLVKINLGHCLTINKINKKIIADTIFSDDKIKKKLESYIFKIVRKKRSQFLKKNKNKRNKIIFLDIPLLLENNLEKDFDLVISIISSKTKRYQRLKNSKKMSKKIFNLILKNQTSDVVRKKRSDIIVYNNKTIKNYMDMIDKTIKGIIS